MTATGDQRHKTYCWNYGGGGGWDEVDSRLVNCTNDTTVVVDVSSPSPYISSTGEVRIYFRCGDNGKTTFDHYIDLVKITASE
jgi:hypothetical protein